MFILLSVVGAFAGLLAGLSGVAGGMVLVPAFFYSFTGLGYAGADTMQVCLATSLATIVVTSLRSLISHHRQAGVDWELLKLWAPGIALGAVFGVLFATQLRSITLQWIFGGFGCTRWHTRAPRSGHHIGRYAVTVWGRCRRLGNTSLWRQLQFPGNYFAAGRFFGYRVFNRYQKRHRRRQQTSCRCPERSSCKRCQTHTHYRPHKLEINLL